jgi:osmotically-inducible protein OsmY
MICQNCLNEIPPNVSVCARCQLPPDMSSPVDEDITAELPVLVLPSRRPWKLAGLFVVGIALAGAAVYLAYVRPRALRDGAVQSLRAEIARMGAPQVVATLDDRWNLRLSGNVAGRALHEDVLAMVRRKTQFKSVADAVTIEQSSDDVAGRVSAALEARWPRQFTASVGPQSLASVSGPVDGAEQRAAVLALVGSQPGVAGVKDATHVSPTWRRNEVRRFLDAKRWRFVTAVVLDDGTIRLTGVVANNKDGRQVTAELREAFPDAPIQSQLTTWRSSERRGKRSNR